MHGRACRVDPRYHVVHAVESRARARGPRRQRRRRPGAARPVGVRPISTYRATEPPRDCARLVARQLKDVLGSGVEYPPPLGAGDTQAAYRQQVGPSNRGVGRQGPAFMLQRR